MRKIVNVPIEGFEERYTDQWNRWIPKFFEEQDVEFETVYPVPLVEGRKTGAFLDVVGTNYFKAMQMTMLLSDIYNNKIGNGDVIFVNDLWFPGLEALQYVRDGLGLDFKLVGILHAGTYDKEDFLSRKGMEMWGRDLENAWFQFIDMIFVATDFHKSMICQERCINPDKIYVTGLPYYSDDIYRGSVNEIEQNVVFPHRLDPEKDPDMFTKLMNDLKLTAPQWQWLMTKDVCNTKKEYYELLGQSLISVSCAKQETWGIAMWESVLSGCVPIVPDTLSYKELYPDLFRYKTYEEASGMLRQLMYGGDVFKNCQVKVKDLSVDFTSRGAKALPNMLDIMESTWGLFTRS